MSTFRQKNTLTYDEAQKKLNEHLIGLEVIHVQNSTSDTRRLFITIHSKNYSANYYLSIGTDIWTWKNKDGLEIPVFKEEYIVDHYHMLAITDAVKNLIEQKLTIKEIEVSEKSKEFTIYFEDGSVLNAQQGKNSEDTSFYQLILDENKTYQNYNLLILGESCLEEFTRA